MSNQFSEVKLMTIVPHSVRWPEAGRAIHWDALHKAVDAARNAVRKASEQAAAIRADSDLSPEGMHRRLADMAVRAISDLEGSGALQRARTSVQSATELFENRVSTEANIKAPTDISGALMAQEIRAHVAKQQSPRNFVTKNADDDRVVSAVLTAPAFLSGLSDTEFNAVAHAVKNRANPEAVQHRDESQKALEHLEAGWNKAIREIATMGQIRRNAEGSWEQMKVAA
jgi:hypothetical protein